MKKFVLVVLLVLILFGCTYQSPSDPLMGTWLFKENNVKQVLILSEAFEIVSTGEVFGTKLKGLWSADKENLLVFLEKETKVFGYVFQNNKDILCLESENGKSISFYRLSF